MARRKSRPSAKEIANLRPAKPGEVRNPKGRPTAGASILEWINVLAAKPMTSKQLRKLARDERSPWTKRNAAIRILRSLEIPDPADYQPALSGKTDLVGLRKMGVDTTAIKKTKFKTRTLRDAEGNEVGTEIECDLELHDRSGDDFDRIVDRTAGRPKQQVDVSNADGSLALRTPADGAAEAAAILAELGVAAGDPPARPAA